MQSKTPISTFLLVFTSVHWSSADQHIRPAERLRPRDRPDAVPWHQLQAASATVPIPVSPLPSTAATAIPSDDATWTADSSISSLSAVTSSPDASAASAAIPTTLITQTSGDLTSSTKEPSPTTLTATALPDTHTAAVSSRLVVGIALVCVFGGILITAAIAFFVWQALARRRLVQQVKTKIATSEKEREATAYPWNPALNEAMSGSLNEMDADEHPKELSDGDKAIELSAQRWSW